MDLVILIIITLRNFRNEVLDYQVDKDLENMERSECFRMNRTDHIGIEVAYVVIVVLFEFDCRMPKFVGPKNQSMTRRDAMTILGHLMVFLSFQVRRRNR